MPTAHKKDLREGRCIQHSHETFDELHVFVHVARVKMVAALNGHHDERVTAVLLANIVAQ
jgi:hypothetical protein